MGTLSRRGFLQGVGLGAVGVATACSTFRHRTPAQAPPNLVFMLTDDQRWDTLGCMGNPVVQTPQLDRLAAEGIILGNCFATTPVCCVSRASIFSGQYARRHGAGDLVRMSDAGPWEQTYPGALQRAGYYIGYIGKYNVGVPETVDRDGMRYDFWAGWQYHGNYWHDRDCPNVTNNGVADKTRNHCTCPPQGELPRVGHEGIAQPVHTTAFVVPEKVRQFLESRDQKAPFCLAIGFKAPKDPWDDFPDELAGLYRGVEMPIPATATPEAAAALPGFLRRSLASDQGLRYAGDHDALSERIRCYYRCVTALDGAVGQIRALLDSHGVARNTVLVFLSDNGHFLADHGLWGKWLGYEPSVRVPGIVYDPRLPARQQGRRLSAMVLNIDVAPTLLALAGVAVPEGMQGTDLTPLLAGHRAKGRDDWFFEHTWDGDGRIEPSEGVRTTRHKYLRYPRQDPLYEQLFDLRTDPLETRNLAAEAGARPLLEALRLRCDTYTRTLAL